MQTRKKHIYEENETIARVHYDIETLNMNIGTCHLKVKY